MTRPQGIQVHKQFEVSEDLTLFDFNAESKESVIKDLAALFERKDLVHDTYLDEVLKREKTMPTGLVTKIGGIAIPHTDTEHVKRSAIAIARMSSPVKFNNMADPTEQVDVNIVFLLAIAEKEQVNPFLGKMAELLQNEPAFQKLLDKTNAKDFVAYFSSMIGIED
jgi:PTS system galactitol-specific IIA component